MKQRARVIWLFGLSGSGKSTLAVALERSLWNDGFTTQLLDGDNLRMGLNRGLGFSDADRAENLRRAAETARLFVQAGVVTVCSFITPLRAHRAVVRQILGDDLLLVHVSASWTTCVRRDPKGLYAKAAAGGVAQFTGRDSGFEEPEAGEAAWRVETETAPPEDCLQRLRAWVSPQIQPATPARTT